MPPPTATEKKMQFPELDGLVYNEAEWKNIDKILRISKIARKERDGPPAAVARHYAAPYAYNYRGELYRHFWTYHQLKDKDGTQIISEEDIKRVIPKFIKGYQDHLEFPDLLNQRGEISKMYKIYKDTRSAATGRFILGKPKAERDLADLNVKSAVLAMVYQNGEKFSAKDLSAKEFDKKAIKDTMGKAIEKAVDMQYNEVKLSEKQAQLIHFTRKEMAKRDGVIQKLKRHLKASDRAIGALRTELEKCSCGHVVRPDKLEDLKGVKKYEDIMGTSDPRLLGGNGQSSGLSEELDRLIEDEKAHHAAAVRTPKEESPEISLKGIGPTNYSHPYKREKHEHDSPVGVSKYSAGGTYIGFGGYTQEEVEDMSAYYED
ncbi:hypothetical protein PVAG01_06747 [Phlyctema vagabunda]|uniref:Uncharacterized protein n=1 Tax=Phlyctema vagabunda TaxID=108571 RepID=A0ABR4PGY2_9HELO